MRQYYKFLRNVTTTRAVGFSDSVRELGTHKWGGGECYYSRVQVYKVLEGKAKSAKLLRLIAEKCPRLVDHHGTSPAVRAEVKRLAAEIAAA